MKYQLGDKRVRTGNHVYLAPGSHVIGDVTLNDNASVWFNAIIRGDMHPIVVGEDTNIQDAAVLHTDKGVPLILGKGVTVGHKAMLHGCEVGDFSLIGINAVVLNGAKIGKYCIIGANALVTENTVIPDYSLVVGSPAKVIRQLDERAEEQLQASAAHYVDNAQYFATELKVQDD